MKRRTWLTGIGLGVFGSVSGCLGSSEDDGDGEDNATIDNGTEENDGPSGEETADRTDADESGFVRRPAGDAEITVRIDLSPGYGEPEEYEIALELSHVELTRANEDGGVTYAIDETLELRKEAGSDGHFNTTYDVIDQETDASGGYPESEYTLVDQEEIPVSTYDYLRLYGSMNSSSTAGNGNVSLSAGDHIERTLGSVFEDGDHTEHTVNIAVSEADQGYEVTDTGMSTITW